MMIQQQCQNCFNAYPQQQQFQSQTIDQTAMGLPQQTPITIDQQQQQLYPQITTQNTETLPIIQPNQNNLNVIVLNNPIKKKKHKRKKNITKKRRKKKKKKNKTKLKGKLTKEKDKEFEEKLLKDWDIESKKVKKEAHNKLAKKMKKLNKKLAKNKTKTEPIQQPETAEIPAGKQPIECPC